MSQVILRDKEIMGLNNQNKNLVEAVKKKEEEMRLFQNKNKEFLDKNDKLVKQLPRQLPIQGSRHILWDMIISEATRIRPYLNYIHDKEMVINASIQSFTAVK